MEKVTEKEYRYAYKEVMIILNVIDSRFKRMIPKEKIDFYEANLDKDYNFEYDYSKPINEQNILEITRCIIANLFKKYIATEKDKAEIIRREEELLRKEEAEKKIQYNANEIFKNSDESQNIKNIESNKTLNSSNELMITSNKKSFIEILKDKIYSFINKLK